MQKLKSMAEGLNIPVVCTECIRKNYHKPSLTDVRRNLAQTFDMVVFLYREDWDYDWADRVYFTTDSNITKLIIAKNRYGDTGTIELKYDKKAKYFTEVKTI